MPLYLPGGAAGPMTAAIEALATTGLIDRTGDGTATTRTTGTTGLNVLAAADEAAARTAIGSHAFAGDATATITTNSVVRSQIDSSGNVSSTIPGGSTLLPEFKCRAWVNFNGTTFPATIRGSGNVSSVTVNATGDYIINFSTPMPDVNYGVAATSSTSLANGSWISGPLGNAPTTSSFRFAGFTLVSSGTGAHSVINLLYAHLAFFR